MPKVSPDKVYDELESLLLELKFIEKKLNLIEESRILGEKTIPE